VITDNQVSNTTRIVFTTLALVAFWMVAWRAFYAGFTLEVSLWCGKSGWGSSDPEQCPWEGLLVSWCFPPTGPLLQLVPAVVYALLPTALLAVADQGGGERRTLSRPAFLVAVLFIFACNAAIIWEIGSRDGWEAVVTWRKAVEAQEQDTAGRPAVHVNQASWLWVLLPLILTTAFVIFDAWRRMVRVEAKH